MSRHFTRQEIESYCLKMHENALGVIEVTSVKLIEDDTIPATLYQVDFSTAHGTDLVNLFVEQEFEPGNFRLWPLVGLEITE